MLHHRFRELVTPTPSATPVGGMCPGFLPLPLPALVGSSLVGTVQEVYRLAAELTRVQLAAPSVRPIPAFSRN